MEAKTLALSSRVDGLQRENEGLIRRCESLERSVQVLDDDALNIAQALQSNTNLRYLQLEDNHALTHMGKLDLYLHSNLGLNRSDIPFITRVVEANLNTVSGANHTCQIAGISGRKNFINHGDKPRQKDAVGT